MCRQGFEGELAFRARCATLPSSRDWRPMRSIPAKLESRYEAVARNTRIILFAGFGGIDGVSTDNTPRLSPRHMRATSFNDDWL